MASKISAKFFEIFRNIKSDAEPRPPRKNGMSNNAPEADNENQESNQEEIFVKRNKKKSKPKYQKSFSAPPEENSELPEEEEDRRSSTASTVHTSGSSNVINIVNSSKVHCGTKTIYFMGPVHGNPSKKYQSEDEDEEPIEKTNVIILLLESDEKLDNDYIDYVSKHLGRHWQSFFRKLGYSQGQIDTAEYDHSKLGVAEVRYQLLLDWKRNDDDGTLGKLANVLWTEGERQIVKELAAMYTKNKK